MNDREQLMRLADEYAHCYAFVGDDSMPRKRTEIEVYAESKQSELDKANVREMMLVEALSYADSHAYYGECEKINIALSTTKETFDAYKREHDAQVLERGADALGSGCEVSKVILRSMAAKLRNGK